MDRDSIVGRKTGMNVAITERNAGTNGKSNVMSEGAMKMAGSIATDSDGFVKTEWSIHPRLLAMLVPLVWIVAILREKLDSVFRWLGVGYAAEYEEQARKLRACSVKFDTCAAELENIQAAQTESLARNGRSGLGIIDIDCNRDNARRGDPSCGGSVDYPRSMEPSDQQEQEGRRARSGHRIGGECLTDTIEIDREQDTACN